MAHQPRKRFGQHFLCDDAVIQSIIAVMSPQKSEHWVEIGPGRGAITRHILSAIGRLTAIELDRDLIAPLQLHCGHLGQLVLHQADILRFDLSQLGHKLRLFGNLPYNIATEVLFRTLEAQAYIDDMHFMLQHEVVERIVAPVNSAHYGRLSVMMQYHYHTRKLLTIPPQAFYPVPKIYSAFVHLVPKKPDLQAHDYTLFADIVRCAFSQKRKMLRNSLKPYLQDDHFQQLKLDPKVRAETLSVHDFVRISNFYQQFVILSK